MRMVADGDLLAEAALEVAKQHRAWPTVGVVAPGSLTRILLDRLRRDLGETIGDAEQDGLARRVTVVAAEGVKGLEFDAVIVIEPTAIAAERDDHAAGLRLLYVALTRPTQHLSIVASTPLPAVLDIRTDGSVIVPFTFDGRPPRRT